MLKAIHPPESIYNLIPKEEVKIEKPPRYTSRYSEQVKQEYRQHKASSRTMGPARVEMPSPDKYLLKHSKGPKVAEKKLASYRDAHQPRKPQIPAKTEQPLAAVRPEKDFVRSNAEANITAVPRKPPPAYAHTKHGDKELLENSGLVPKYITKKDYGQTPEYIRQRQEMERTQEEYNHYVMERKKEVGMNQLSEEEQQEILNSLKKQWNDVNHQYQGMSLNMNMLSKKQRKEKLELQMTKLEKQIKLMERYKNIYITKD